MQCYQVESAKLSWGTLKMITAAVFIWSNGKQIFECKQFRVAKSTRYFPLSFELKQTQVYVFEIQRGLSYSVLDLWSSVFVFETPHTVSATSDQRPATCDLRPATCDLRPATCDLRSATCDLRPATCDLRPATCELWPVIYDLWPATSDQRPVTCDLPCRPTVGYSPLLLS